MARKQQGNSMALQKQKESQIFTVLHNEKFLQEYAKTIPASLAGILTPARAANILYRAVQKNPRLLDCEPDHLKQVLLDSAILGLELAGPLRHAHVVPYWDKHKKMFIPQLQIGYQGFLELARRTGNLLGAPVVQWVFENDIYELNVADPEHPIKHMPCLKGERGEPLFVYCVARFRDAGLSFDFMTYTDMEKFRDTHAPRDANGKIVGPWVDSFLEMGKKTILKRAAKMWPLSSEMARALEKDEQAELVNAGKIEFDPVTGEVKDEEPKSKADELANKLKQKQEEQVTVDGEVVEGVTMTKGTMTYRKKAEELAKKLNPDLDIEVLDEAAKEVLEDGSVTFADVIDENEAFKVCSWLQEQIDKKEESGEQGKLV